MTTPTQSLFRSYIIEEYHLTKEPYYVSVADEIELFEAAYRQRIPILFKGPTGCGKTRFVEYMVLSPRPAPDAGESAHGGRAPRRGAGERPPGTSPS